MSKCDMVLSRKVFSSSCRSSFRNSPGLAVPAFETTRPISRSFVCSASFGMKPSCERSIVRARTRTPKSLVIWRPTSLSNASLLATSTRLIPAAAICRANSGPIPDEAPVTSAHGPNRCLSSNAFMFPPLLSALTRQLLRDLLLRRFVSQRVDPILKALHFHHHHLGVVGAMRHGSHPLKGGEEMHCKFTCVLIVAGGPELLLKPADGLSEERRGFLRESAALPVQLRAQPAKRASSARQLLPVRVDPTHESYQPLFRPTQAVHPLPGSAKLPQAP